MFSAGVGDIQQSASRDIPFIYVKNAMNQYPIFCMLHFTSLYKLLSNKLCNGVLEVCLYTCEGIFDI